MSIVKESGKSENMQLISILSLVALTDRSSLSHTTNSYYEISPNHFIGKGKLTDTDELPDGRRITKHSFWMPKKFLKEVFEGKWD